MPPVLLILGHVVYGHHLATRYAALGERLQAGARETVLWIAGIVGTSLLVTRIVEYVARFVL